MGVSGPEVPASVERRRVINRLFGRSKEDELVQELPVAPEIPSEIEQGQTLIGDDYNLAKPVVDDRTGQVLVAPAGTEELGVNLPLTEEKIQIGLKEKFSSSFYWLANLCVRFLKKAKLIKNES